MARFSYEPIDVEPCPADPGTTLYRPILPIRVRGGGGSVVVKALVDTGASVTLFSFDVWAAVIPKFAGEEGRLLGANQSAFPVLYGSVELELKLGDVVHRWRAKVGFSNVRDESILGDAGFLRYFPVSFYRSRNEFIVRPPENLPT